MTTDRRNWKRCRGCGVPSYVDLDGRCDACVRQPRRRRYFVTGAERSALAQSSRRQAVEVAEAAAAADDDEPDDPVWPPDPTFG